MSDIQSLSENLNNREILLLKQLQQYPIRVDEGLWLLSDPPKNLLENNLRNFSNRIIQSLNALEEKGITEKRSNEIYLTALGQNVVDYLHGRNRSQVDGEDVPLSKSQQQKQTKLAKSNEMLELYKQGLTYQDIGDLYNLTRERVRQLLDFNPAFHAYLIERESAKAQAQIDKEETKKQEQLANSIFGKYPERVAELWDYEKNTNLNPEEISAGSTGSIWLKCPIDGYSWQKRPNDITTSWDRGSSGCPKCAGKSKKAEKQPILIEVYPALISKYWDYEKNNDIGINPSEVTLSSNKKGIYSQIRE